VAYQTYGGLNADKSNAILICHALTGDQYVAETHPITGKPGWWEMMVGPGKPIDTDRFFVICANVIGGCMGSSGPLEIDPATGRPYGLGFPVITIGDMVRAQKLLVDSLGIEQLFCVLGGSMGGMQVLQWAAAYPERVFSAIPIACAARHSAQNIAFHEVGRQAIMADPEWTDGDYLLHGRRPTAGLAVARMAAHITYLSETALHRKFGRELQDRSKVTYGFDADFRVESYLRHQGSTFVDRFDANSYLYITRAMDYFDLAAEHGGQLANAFRNSTVRFCVASFTSDWLFPTSESRAIVHALNAVAADVSFVEIVSDKGHDAFLLDEPEFHAVIRGFLEGCAEQRGLAVRAPAVQAYHPSPRRPGDIRVDLRLIAGMIEPGSRVLDVGCGDGELLAYLEQEKQVDARGLELRQERVHTAVSHGLAVIQGDANTDLKDYPSDAFDYVILSQTLQAMQDPKAALEQMVRIGRRAIVSFQNFGYWPVRAGLFVQGRMPVTKSLPHQWWETPNIHNCTITDFVALTRVLDVEIERTKVLRHDGRVMRFNSADRMANLFGEQAVFLLRRK
jgi:homoserine O-acetyltransferase